MQREIYEKIMEASEELSINLLPEIIKGNYVELARVVNIDLSEIDDDISYSLTEHMLATYIYRLVREKEVNEDEISFILSIWGQDPVFNSIIKGFIGDLAVHDQLEDNEKYISLRDQYLDKDDWAYRQIYIRLLLNNSESITNEVLDEIISYRTVWAIYELIPTMPQSVLEYLKGRLNEKTCLTRVHRHEIKEYLRKLKL